jgi:hypothetical protein
MIGDTVSSAATIDSVVEVAVSLAHRMGLTGLPDEDH